MVVLKNAAVNGGFQMMQTVHKASLQCHCTSVGQSQGIPLSLLYSPVGYIRDAVQRLTLLRVANVDSYLDMHSSQKIQSFLEE